MGDEQQDPKMDLSKISTIVGIIAGIAGILAVAAGIYKDWNPAPQASSKANDVKFRVVQDVDRFYCHLLVKCGNQKFGREDSLDFRIKVQKIMPYYLANTLKESQNYLYWTAYDATNKCSECTNLGITLSSENSDMAKVDSAPFKYSICPNAEMRDANIDPVLKFMREDVSGTLKLHWELVFQNGKAISQSVPIRILSDNIVYWDLKNPDGENVPFDFILASLTAWTLSPISEQGAKYLGPSSPDQSIGEWMESCYEALFNKKGHLIAVAPYQGPWPPTMKNDDSMERIRSPQDSLTVKRIDSVEASLLVSALAYRGFKDTQRLVLVALSSATSDGKQFLLAWPKTRDSWEAVDMTAPNGVAFEDNLRDATGCLNAALKSAPIVKELDSRGVYASSDRRVVAIDFVKASQRYQIRGLP
jgi:hypothetical protein